MSSPKKEANRISSLLKTRYGNDRFPVDAGKVAEHYSEMISPEAPITKIKPLSVQGFEGCLQQNPKSGNWRICYNPDQVSPGRVRFTLAHELGHFVLHRKIGEDEDGKEPRPEFLCSEVDMNDWDSPLRQMEAEADTFASYLLMPLDDFRKQVSGQQSMKGDLLDHCRNRYGVSRMATALKWVEVAPKRTIVVAARDGYLLWARSNKKAYKSGCYLPARQKTIVVPSQSMLAQVEQTRGSGQGTLEARSWFPHEPAGMPLVETAISVENPSYPYILGILQMPDAERGWDETVNDEELLRPLTKLQW